MRRALELSFNGIGTSGNYLGFFNNNLVLSAYISLKELTADKLAECIFAFSENAMAVKVSLFDSYEEEQEGLEEDDDNFDNGKLPEY